MGDGPRCPAGTPLVSRCRVVRGTPNHTAVGWAGAGVRKEVRVQGKSVLLFWYRNEIYAIEAR